MSETAAEPKAKRRWYQYSLRSLLIFVTVVCLIMGFMAQALRSRLEFRESAAPIWELDGAVIGDASLGAKGATFLQFSHRSLTDADLKALSPHLLTLPNIERLVFTHTRITDAGLIHLKGIKTNGLWLCNTQVTDAGLAHLRGLTELEELWLNGTQVSDVGLKSLGRLTALEWLHLANTQITDAGLVHLEGLTNLRSLDLTGTQVTDEGVENLQEALPNCSIFQ